jgi:hypothetical protein
VSFPNTCAGAKIPKEQPAPEQIVGNEKAASVSKGTILTGAATHLAV